MGWGEKKDNHIMGHRLRVKKIEPGNVTGQNGIGNMEAKQKVL
jgi:hypothetical protein